MNAADVDNLTAEAAAADETAAREGQYIPASEAPPGQGEQVKDYDDETASSFAGLALMLSAMFAPNWKVSDEECVKVGVQAARVSKKYFPNVVVGCELALAGEVAAVILPRMNTPRYPEPEKTDDGKSASG